MLILLIHCWLLQSWSVTFGYRIGFRGFNASPDSKETNLGSSDQEAFPSLDKNTEVVILPCSRMKVMSLQLFLLVRIFLSSLGVICYNRWVLSEDHKNYLKDCCLLNSQPTFLFIGVVPTIFFASVFLCLKESTFEMRKNVFYFTLEALFVLEIIRLWLFKSHDIIKCLNTKHETHFYE